MKSAKILAILVLVLGQISTASADLVAHYQFEADANDSSGNEHHGTLMGNAWIVPTALAKRGQVLDIDQGDGWVEVPHTPLFDITDQITVATWIKVRQFDDSNQQVVCKGNNMWRLGRDGNNQWMEFSLAGVGEATGKTNVNDGDWHHVAGIYDQSNLTLYVDGAVDETVSAPGNTIGTDTGNLFIGIEDNKTDDWNGWIDDVHIYNHALSEAEIANLALSETDGWADSDWIISGNNMYSGVSGNVGIGTGNPESKLEVNSDGEAILGTSHNGTGVSGLSIEDAGVSGASVAGPGVLGLGTMSPGVVGMNVFTGAYGDLGHRDGVFGENPEGYAGFFEGDVVITGRLSKGSGSFKIDHPLDPENKYLQHSFVESPDMMNIYNGMVILDENGQVVVQLPDYFEALNCDFRYQLTCIGGFAPVYIAEKISDKRFKIAGGKPNMEVSWQITGIRRDPYANKNRVVVEDNKSLQEKGYYLHPEAYGLPKEKSIGTVRKPRLPKIREMAKR